MIDIHINNMYNIFEVIYHMGTNFKNLIYLIEKNGWKYDRTKGSHYIYVKNGVALSVPKHNKDIGKGLYHKILKEAGIK